jgi:hypothetical protein|tara:strand:- start:389 stop:637 length:249 start_codon:yes stop_codon:yes gene_type:complete
MNNTESINRLKNIGNEWIAGDKHRIYFNEPAQYILNISNNKARKINNYCKVFFDVNDGSFFHQGLTDESAIEIFAALRKLSS